MKTQPSNPKTEPRKARPESRSDDAKKAGASDQGEKRPDIDTPNRRTPERIEKQMQRSPKQENL
jgi:hypothetical protein